MSTPVFPVILCGGAGTRLWPMSRRLMPKQFLALASERTMLQETAKRLSGEPGIGAPIVVCSEEHRFLVSEQLRAIDLTPACVVLEPAGRNTAPAIAAAALAALERHQDAILFVLPSDHVVGGREAFLEAGR